MCGAMCGAFSAHAAEFPPPMAPARSALEPVVQLQHTCGSNLFGLSSGAAALAAFGDAQLSDCWTTTQLGLRFDNDGAVSHLQGHALLGRTLYRHYTGLDATTHDLALNYNLNHAPQWSAYASASDQTAQQDLALLQSPLPDLVRKQVLVLGGERQVAGPLSWTGNVVGVRIRNEAASQRPYDMNIQVLGTGPLYTSNAGNSVGATLTLLQGHYPHADAQAAGGLQSDYRQTEAAARFAWADAPVWKVSGTAGYLRHTASALPALDFSGAVADVQADWAVTAATDLGLKLYRKLAAYNTATTNYQVVTGGELSAGWTLNATVRLLADLRHDSARFPGSDRRDTIRSAGLTLRYRPRSGTQLALRYAWLDRSSNAVDASYSNRILSLSLQQAF